MENIVIIQDIDFGDVILTTSMDEDVAADKYNEIRDSLECDNNLTIENLAQNLFDNHGIYVCQQLTLDI